MELIHEAIRLQARDFLLRATSLASDEGEYIQDSGDIADTPRSSCKSLLHVGMLTSQGFDMVAHTSQAVNFQKKVLKRAGQCLFIGS
jgi:hypothetical protein